MDFTINEPPYALHPVPITEGRDADNVVEALSVDPFKDLIDSEIDVIGANAATRFVLIEAIERPKSQYPGQKRMPFCLILHGPLHIELTNGQYDLRVPGLGIVPGILLTRVTALPNQPPGAYYEVVFC